MAGVVGIVTGCEILSGLVITVCLGMLVFLAFWDAIRDRKPAEKCPWCAGRGWVPTYIGGGEGKPPSPPVTDGECEFCKGSGLV